MRSRFFVTVWLLLVVACAVNGQTAPVEIAPNPFRTGDTIVIRFNFSAKKIVISGGRFGAGTVVTGKPFVRDKPRIATRYTVIVTNPDPKSSKKLTTTRYLLVAQKETPLSLATYHAKRGWTFEYPRAWHDDHVNTPEEGRDGLIFFQQEDDALERIAVAVLPVKPTDTPMTLWRKARSDVPSRYDRPEFLPEKETSHYLLPALTTEFIGMDRSHPGKKTHTMMLIFIQEDRGYLVSVRTEEAKFEGRKAFVEKMVRSLKPVLVKPTQKPDTNREPKPDAKQSGNLLIYENNFFQNS